MASGGKWWQAVASGGKRWQVVASRGKWWQAVARSAHSNGTQWHSTALELHSVALCGNCLNRFLPVVFPGRVSHLDVAERRLPVADGHDRPDEAECRVALAHARAFVQREGAAQVAPREQPDVVARLVDLRHRLEDGEQRGAVALEHKRHLSGVPVHTRVRIRADLRESSKGSASMGGLSRGGTYA